MLRPPPERHTGRLFIALWPSESGSEKCTNSICGILFTKWAAASSTTLRHRYPGREKRFTALAMCSSLRLPTKAAVVLPASLATVKMVGTLMKPRSGCHEFQ